jgi:murein DD-endopeptidase MepM/ murein hydrolase activator NlpD
MSKLWLVAGGAGAAYLLMRSSAANAKTASASHEPHLPPLPPGQSMPQSSPRETPARLVLNGKWVWPVETWQQRRPVISDGWGSPRPGRTHRGVDVMFARIPSDTWKVGTPNGSRNYVLPEGVLAIAATDGMIWSAGDGPRGHSVVIDHGRHGGHPISTFYTHLQNLLVLPTRRGQTKQRVLAGQPLGIIGGNPLDAQRLKHLHFELWRDGVALNPAALMSSWIITPSTFTTGAQL